ncbi:MAG: polysaccharide biosynthesis protein, partial [Firmicutes bacterium]|nr:polysaccharide biosynthesis protein [Bacillota bacterium]
IQQELIRQYGLKNPETGEGLDVEVVIASVRDSVRIEEIFDEYRPEIVFHAAAHKHVPLMEGSSCEAIKNNVLGTYNVANAAEKFGVKNFLLVSSDKAVNPTNIMGSTKTLCEMVVQCRQDSNTKFCATRFGNVLGSNGSVIPLFRKQIEAGGPLTITDKRIIRYFMTIPEAASLLVEACAMAGVGHLYVLDMGKPVKILDVAEDMIRLSGFKPYEDIDIVEIGLRPGEKLYEELLVESQTQLGKTDNDMIFIEHMTPLTREEVEGKLDILREAIVSTEGRGAKSGHRDAVLAAIKATVPTYRTPEEVNSEGIKGA